MTYKRFVKVWFAFITIIPVIAGFNYLIDPYNIYHSNFINKPKIQQSKKIRLVKAIKTEEIKPISICLGTSRAEYGYDPTHKYFDKPSYNLATAGSSMYENRLNFENALKQGNLKKVLLVLDYRMFNAKFEKRVNDFESYFGNSNLKYKYLFSIDVLKDSIKTLKGGENRYYYLENGQLENTHNWNHVLKSGGHLELMKRDEKEYYKDYPVNYTYEDTNKKSFPDFESVVRDCYKNNIDLDIVFGPSHIRQWEALNYYLGYDNWLKWKKDIVLTVNKIAKEYKEKQFRIMDFSVYHQLTSEKIPQDKNIKMKYYWESSHYKNELGLIVLDRLLGVSQYKNFGVELNLGNIDAHLEKQKIKRSQYIDTKKYQLEIWGKEDDQKN